ncbi:hypothetical protein AALO_G00272450 [Alosa alosa]|uniref:Uncharacterized protein n=1 Tax=Alosa alosa TaxID=278164 RepID=A0AAV6FSN4_9TELE|nr:hypothetical protein AALO_G00272450 [Alosa alosa]
MLIVNNIVRPEEFLMLLVCLIHYVSKEQEWAGNRNTLLKTWPTNWRSPQAFVLQDGCKKLFDQPPTERVEVAILWRHPWLVVLLKQVEATEREGRWQRLLLLSVCACV